MCRIESYGEIRICLMYVSLRKCYPPRWRLWLRRSWEPDSHYRVNDEELFPRGKRVCNTFGAGKNSDGRVAKERLIISSICGGLYMVYCSCRVFLGRSWSSGMREREGASENVSLLPCCAIAAAGTSNRLFPSIVPETLANRGESS